MEKQIQMLETALSQACDDAIEIRDTYLKAKKEAEDAKDALKTAGQRVAELMVKEGMESCKHGGIVFFVKEPDTTLGVVMKEE